MSFQVDDIEKSIDEFVEEFGYRLESIFPADNPVLAELSRDDLVVRLSAPPRKPGDKAGQWVEGRAGMQYRDLLPDRQGGKLIASHIRIPIGGPVPDYVHYHSVRFQMIHVVKGWVRVVYEDQGEPFVMNPGDCVLQPPGIRHRVLESSDGLEVIEMASPANHFTYVDHDLVLPNSAGESSLPDMTREWEGQRFCFHRAMKGNEISDTGIGAATGGLADGVVAAPAGPDLVLEAIGDGQFQINVVLSGKARLKSGWWPKRLKQGDVITVQPGFEMELKNLSSDFELLRVTLKT